jgi:hypothetical protein
MPRIEGTRENPEPMLTTPGRLFNVSVILAAIFSTMVSAIMTVPADGTWADGPIPGGRDDDLCPLADQGTMDTTTSWVRLEPLRRTSSPR